MSTSESDRIIQIRDAYRHDLFELRERTLGQFRDLEKWLSTAQDAAEIDPPSLPAIRERLRDALALIDRESARLRMENNR